MTNNFSKTDFCTIFKNSINFLKSMIRRITQTHSCLVHHFLVASSSPFLMKSQTHNLIKMLWIFKLGICDWWSEIRKMDESTLACCHKKLKLIFKWREFNRLHDLGFSVVYLISEVFFHHLLFLLHISPCLSEIYLDLTLLYIKVW